MLLKALTLATVIVAPLVEGHYIFNRLIVDGKSIGGEYTYVRKNSNSYNPAFTNDIVNSNNLRCNVGAKPSTSTQTYTVSAGTKLGFKLFNNEFIEHPGPGFVYMSKVPEGSSLSTYDGSGDWFKAYETGLCGRSPGTDSNWCSYQKDRLEYTLPKNIPPGDYLVRVEHIGLHEGHQGRAQFYIECYQFKIEGPGGGDPSPLFKIPGIYTADDPGIRFNKWNNPTSYIMPGPPLWEGQEH